MSSPAYERRIARVLAHIDDHLADELSLDALAQVSGFSKFHFHRVFKAMVGETLHGYLARVRVERGAALLVHKVVDRVGDAALACGYKTQAHFARAFRERYGVPPSRAASLGAERLTATSSAARAWVHGERGASSAVEVGTWEAGEVATLRVIGFEPDRLVAGFVAMDAWLAARGIDRLERVGIVRDDPDLVALDRFRYEIGSRVPPGTRASGGVTVRAISAQPVAILRVEGTLLDVIAGWKHLFERWLPSSRYEPADAPALERIFVSPSRAGWESLVVDLCLPVRPLRS